MPAVPFKEEPSVEIFNEDFKRLYDSSPPVDLEPRETLGMISHIKVNNNNFWLQARNRKFHIFHEKFQLP